MKIIQVHNKYRFAGGEDAVVKTTIEILSKRGIDVFLMTKESESIGNSFCDKLAAFISSLNSFSSARKMKQIIDQVHPDVVHVHNVYPLLSPSIIAVCRRAAIPVVMTCHNYRLTCPTGNHFREEQICELCAGGREYWCVLRNCRSDLFESLAYAVRSSLARITRVFHENVTLFIALSKFAKDRLVAAGIANERIFVLPQTVYIPSQYNNASEGKYFLYVGRISPEKGVDILLEAASQTRFPVVIAGDYSSAPNLIHSSPQNVKFLGFIERRKLDSIYGNARCLIVPSKCFEASPLVISEAMAYGLPVIASNLGGLPELVDNGVTGLLFDAGNSEELADKMSLLWENPELCGRMGHAGWKVALAQYNTDAYHKRLVDIYNKAIELSRYADK